jgi:hypothetical protein
MVCHLFVKIGDGPLTVYRGVIPEHERGMSWTTNIDRARWFASRWIHAIQPGAESAYVYQTTAPRSAIMCEMDVQGLFDGIQNENEVVLDPELIEEVDQAESIVQGQQVSDPRTVS